MSSFQVQIWEITKRRDRKARPWRVRWAVDGERFEELFKTKALAHSFRAGLIKAANDGEPFDRASGQPMSAVRAENATTWLEHARRYVEMKWPDAAAKSRRGIVEALVTVTSVLVSSKVRGRPPGSVLRSALYRFALHPKGRTEEMTPAEAAALVWLERASLPVADTSSPEWVRRVLDALRRRLDGKPAAASVVQRKRAIFYNAFGYAVELGLVDSNPIDRVQWKTPEVAEAIDRRVAANPAQVRAILAALNGLGRRARRLVAFFGCLYYAGMRPSEAAGIRHRDCHLPKRGWGRIVLAETEPHAGTLWTDDGRAHERRGLKHRARTATRTVPIPPELISLLREHIYLYGAAADGRLFRGLHGGPLSESVYDRWWRLARAAALTPAQAESPLARRPYDLRHAAASLWLNAGVPPTEVASRLGHGVAVLLRVYANCVDGGDDGTNERIGGALR